MKTYTLKIKILRALFVLCMLTLIVYAGTCSYHIYQLSKQRAELQNDYSEVNNISYGLLSVNRWRDNITEIVDKQIEGFSFSKKQEQDLKKEIDATLNALITKVHEMINEKQTDLKGKVRKFAYNTFVNEEKIREKVPEFSETIIAQIRKPSTREKLKALAREKIDEFAAQTRDSIAVRGYDSLLAKYYTTNAVDFNRVVAMQAEILHLQSYHYTYHMLGVLAIFLFMWLCIYRVKFLHGPLYILSGILAFVFLFSGITSPMIEIDARIQHINFLLVGKAIEFHDQVLFYQSKSILDIVKILVETGKADSILVGALILLFSIIFPALKLISTKLYLLGSASIRNSSIIRFFAFKSGKWSMADVMVVAIFMAYIGFKGILSGQVGNMNTNMNNEYVASIATSKTSLLPGFILFIAFVLFGLILSAILKKITPKPEMPTFNTLQFLQNFRPKFRRPVSIDKGDKTGAGKTK
jgi:hypothetical protein